jgi:hypothetical protein
MELVELNQQQAEAVELELLVIQVQEQQVVLVEQVVHHQYQVLV